MDHITDHTTQADDQLPSSTFGKNDIVRAIVEICSEEIQDLEDLVYDLFSKRLFANAEGLTLDYYGKLFSTPRRNLSDAEYRKILYGALLAINSEHGLEEIIVKIVYGITESEEIQIDDLSPGGYQIAWEVDSVNSDETKNRIVELLEIATSYGVNFLAIEAETPAFRLDSSTNGLDSGKLGESLS